MIKECTINCDKKFTQAFHYALLKWRGDGNSHAGRRADTEGQGRLHLLLPPPRPLPLAAILVSVTVLAGVDDLDCLRLCLGLGGGGCLGLRLELNERLVHWHLRQERCGGVSGDAV